MNASKPKPNSKLTRRTFLRSALAACGAGLIGGVYGTQIEPRWVELVERSLPIHNLPDALEGKTLVQISDMHIGNDANWRYQIDIFKELAAQAPDFVVYTGDFVSYNSAEDLSNLNEALSHAPKGTLGTAGILGNHDYGPGWNQTDTADVLVALLSSHNIRMLRNETDSFSGLQIAGVEEFWSPNYDPRFLAEIDLVQPTIALCHNPDVLDEPVWGSYAGWVLAGHTHGGQVKPPFLPPLIVPVSNKRYTSGAFELDGGRSLYINRGLGSQWSLRLNARPEVTRFTLTKQAST